MSAIPWGLVARAAAVLGFLLVLWWVVGRIRVSYTAEKERDIAVSNLGKYRARVQVQARRFAKQQAVDQKADEALTSRLNKLQDENDHLKRVISRMATTVETTDAQGNRRISINPDLWLCVSTFVSRDAADIAACEARSGASGLPGTVGH